MEHLLKLEHSPAVDPQRSWILSAVEHRCRAQKILKRNGTIPRRLPDLMPDARDEGRKLAAKAPELYDDLNPTSLPTDCPYTPEQILADDFYPLNRRRLP